MKYLFILCLCLITSPVFLCSCNPPVPSTPEEIKTAENTTPVARPAVKESVTEPPMPRGTADPDFIIEKYNPAKVWPGVTIFAANYDLSNPRIVEVNMWGEITWQYMLPDDFKNYINPGFDVEPLPAGDVLFVLPGKGVYEINRNGKIVWSYVDSRVSHDADRLLNGNTLIDWYDAGDVEAAQAKEVNSAGVVVWSWRAKTCFYKEPYINIRDGGWTHANAVERLPNGNTLISLRNFSFVAEVDSVGSLVKKIGEGIFYYQHDPHMLPNGNILAAGHRPPREIAAAYKSFPAMEIDPNTGQVLWKYGGGLFDEQLPRDADRLPNGNTLITGTTKIIEVTPAGEIVWQLRLKQNIPRQEWPGRGFYKAERSRYTGQ